MMKRDRNPGRTREAAIARRTPKPPGEDDRWAWDKVGDALKAAHPEFPIAAEVAYRIAMHHRQARLPLGWEGIEVPT